MCSWAKLLCPDSKCIGVFTALTEEVIQVGLSIITDKMLKQQKNCEVIG